MFQHFLALKSFLDEFFMLMTSETPMSLPEKHFCWLELATLPKTLLSSASNMEHLASFVHGGQNQWVSTGLIPSRRDHWFKSLRGKLRSSRTDPGLTLMLL